MGIVRHTYSGGLLTFAVNQADTTTGYAFEFSVSGGGQPTTIATTTKAETTNPPTTTPSTVAQYRQCAGYGRTGGTTCVSPYTCKYSNDWYSQCL